MCKAQSSPMESERTYPRLDILKFVCDVNCGLGGKDCRCPVKHVDAEDKSNLMCAAKSSNPLVSIWTTPFSPSFSLHPHPMLDFCSCKEAHAVKHSSFSSMDLFLESWAGI